jgi:hypothetical protein
MSRKTKGAVSACRRHRLGQLDPHKCFFQHGGSIGLKSANEANLIGLRIEFAQALDLHAQSIDDPIIAEISKQTDILAGRERVGDEFRHDHGHAEDAVGFARPASLNATKIRKSAKSRARDAD